MGEGDEQKGNEGEGQQGEQVQLTTEQYQAMLDHMAKLEDAVTKSSKIHSIDELAEEGKGKKVEQQGPDLNEVDFDKLSPQQTMDLMMQALNANLIQPLEMKMETMRVGMEIERCANKNEDFWQYADEVKKMAIENPTLSIDKAYKLAKAENPSKASSKGDEGKGLNKSGLLFTLPKVPQSRQPLGEKPNAMGVISKEKTPETRRGAAEQAWEEIVEKGKKKD